MAPQADQANPLTDVRWLASSITSATRSHGEQIWTRTPPPSGVRWAIRRTRAVLTATGAEPLTGSAPAAL
jgi:hypothetical protein